MSPGEVAVVLELRQPHLLVGVVSRRTADRYHVDGIRVEVHRYRVGPATDDDVAGVVDDHRTADRVVDAAPGMGPQGVAVRVELDEVGVVLASGVVVFRDAGVEVQVDVLPELPGDVDVACRVDVDAVAVAAGAIAGVAALPLRRTDPLAGSVGGELGHEGVVVVVAHAGGDRLAAAHNPRMGPEVPCGVRAAVVAEDAAVDRTVGRADDTVPLVVAGRVELDDHARLVRAARVDGGHVDRVGVQVGGTTEVAAGDEAAISGDGDVFHAAVAGAVEDDCHGNVFVGPRLGGRCQRCGSCYDDDRRHGDHLGGQRTHLS